MKKLLIFLGIVALIAAGAIFFWQRQSVSKQETEFKFEILARGDLENMVSSTGTLSAVGTVEVSSQISGTLEKVLVDYNDKVKKGQLLAVVDTTLLAASVRDAEANVAKSRAQLNQAQTEYQRNETLFKNQLIAEMTLLAKKTDVETVAAGLQSAESALQRAQINLKYAQIRSPITGTVIERSVEVGQTISASTSAPTLFTIAEDLSKMQIEAAVDESDIGQIKEGLPVRFTVQAYPDETFAGTVRQIRLKPKTVQDVVNYTVIVDAMNEKELLLPGMTATVDFLVEERKSVLLVPNSALYFQPPQELLAALQQQFQANAANRQGNPPGAPNPENGNSNGQPPEGQRRRRPEGQQETGGNFGQRPPGGEGQMSGGENSRPNAANKMARVFYLDDTGKPQMARFISGVTDGSMTEVVRSPQLTEGTRVITGISTAQNNSDKNNGFSLPLPGLGGGGRRPPGF